MVEIASDPGRIRSLDNPGKRVLDWMQHLHKGRRSGVVRPQRSHRESGMVGADAGAGAEWTRQGIPTYRDKLNVTGG